VTAEIKADPYFAHDETHVFAVASVDDVRDMGHGVKPRAQGRERQNTHTAHGIQHEHQQPRAHRAGACQCGTRIVPTATGMLYHAEIPVIDMLPGSREEIVATLV
jgi:diaminopimelate dehydrogenase